MMIKLTIATIGDEVSEQCEHAKVFQLPEWGCPWCAINNLSIESTEQLNTINKLTAECDSYRQQAEINAQTVREQAQEIAKLEAILSDITGCISGHDGIVFDAIYELLQKAAMVKVKP